MAYTPTRWVNGQPPALNAENLNNIENGISSILGASKNVFDTTWNIGTYYATINPSVNTRRYAVVPCSAGELYTLNFSTGNWYFWVYFADADGVINYKQYTPTTVNKTIEIVSTAGRIPTEIRFNAYYQPDMDLSGSAWDSFDVTCVTGQAGEVDNINQKLEMIEQQYRLRVATMNVGLWYDGITEGVPNENLYETAAKWRRMIGEKDADIICGQEWREYFDRNRTQRALEYIFAFNYANLYSTAQQLGKFIASKYEMSTPTIKAFDSGSTNRGYIKTYITVGGKKIAIINAHTSIEENFETHRRSEFNELKTLMLNETYAICFGDMNAYSLSEFDVFTSAGLNVANHGIFGDFETWTNFDKPSTWTNKALDNIVTTSNIKIKYVLCDREDLSDHNLLMAEVRLD